MMTLASRRSTRLLASFATLAAVSPAVAHAAPRAVPAAPPRAVTVTKGADGPAVSPDGKRIAVSILGRIFLLPIAGGEAQQLSDGIGWDTRPAWSPDGQFIAYAHQLASGTDIVVRNLADGTSRFVYHTPVSVGQIAFAPAGDELFFVLHRNQYDAHLWRLPLSGEQPMQLTHAENWHEWSFALSPDGTRMFLESGRYGGADLYLMSLPGRAVERLTRTPDNEFAVAWARDGRRVWFRQADGVDHLMVQPADGGAPREVWSSPYDEKTIALTPDGTAVIVCGGRRLVRVDLASGKATPIPFTARFTLPDRAPGDLVVTNARVFTGTGDGYIPNATVVVRDGRITEVSPGASAARLPAGVRVLDARGKTLVPGLMDNHWHYWNAFTGGRLLARGVTSIRDPGVAVSTSMNFRDAISLGLLAGPDIYTAGPLIDGPGGYHPMVDIELSRPEAAAPLVRALKAQGVDLLKVYFMLDPAVLAAVVKAAHTEGLPVTGHIGVHTSWGEAMDAGIDGFSHVRVWKDFLPPELQPQGEHESLDARTATIARMQSDWSRIDPDGERATALIQRMVESGVAFDPTLTVQRIGERDRGRYGLETYQVARDTYDKMGRFVRRAQEAGVPILAGTDDGDLFAELEAYAAVGIPNAEILRAATVNGARWLHKAGDFGTIQPGRRADFLLVDGDPLRDIRDLRKIVVVVKDGRIVVRR